jgi:[ribosomal protein S5]-alanine N-acetyltransferase
MNTILVTDRLVLREFTIDDAAFIFELLNTPLWLQFIGDRNVHSLKDAELYLQNGPIKSYQENGFGFYAVLQKEIKQAIGMCGFAKRDYLDNPDIGFAFLAKYYGKGFGFEAAKACLDYGHNTLKINTILATVMPQNSASIGLLKKLGMNFEKMLATLPTDTELMLFSCTNTIK